MQHDLFVTSYWYSAVPAFCFVFCSATNKTNMEQHDGSRLIETPSVYSSVIKAPSDPLIALLDTLYFYDPSLAINEN